MNHTIPTIAPPADLAPLKLGGHAALDFLNSVITPGEATLDFLHDGRTLMRWLAHSGVLSEDVALAAKRFTPAQCDQLALEARKLREWFRTVVMHWSLRGEAAVRPAELARLNDLMAHGALSLALKRTPDGLALEQQAETERPEAVLAQLATVCAQLLSDQAHARVSKCENPACTLLFADNKRGPMRRWCSMAVCGNRMKVAAHRARKREADA